ncbi:isopenicillin N synthase-like dioxygenase [Sphingobium sp. B2D3A]|uniref:isopenicillin N synthase family dioxygenase n=1 Tax=unclassified Sphingobium TaxID=2611147 RepID=UPI00222571E8|nr:MULTISPECIES: 2OG-Fe(II) oxygenase family protein [unclassified Sphingobium]MCW2338468.1 isopenicillin N synthase-like dioxygenase [Sphingobium sp. B2D3A]MCW2384926.1 isopenicillin N synthase-like dioxygenase [Sphingobium sp. B2D3D]
MSDFALPIIDLSALESDDTSIRRTAVERLKQASLQHGFFYLVGHGLSQERLGLVLKHAESLFALSETEKRAIANQGTPGGRGYALMGGRTSEGALQRPLKEEYYLGREDVHEPANLWPAGLPAFKAFMLAHVTAMHDIARRLMTGFAASLDLPRDYFSAFCKDPIAAVRLVHYSAAARGAGAHSDFGSLTLLVQDDVGGLQVFDRDAAGWIDATPLPGSLVVNVGDLFERWTNGRYRSSVHRVVNTAGVDRYSAPFFLTGAPQQEIACLPSCLADGEVPLYPPIAVAQHLKNGFEAQGF